MCRCTRDPRPHGLIPFNLSESISDDVKVPIKWLKSESSKEAAEKISLIRCIFTVQRDEITGHHECIFSNNR